MTRDRGLRAAAWLLLPLAGAAAAWAGWALGPHIGQSTKIFPLVAVGLAGLVALATAMLLLDPAWILSAGLALSIFSGNWSALHVPGPVDRVVTLAGIAAVVLRAWLSTDYPRLAVRRVHWLMALLVLYAGASAAAAGTLTQHAALFELLDRLGAVPFLLYLVAPTAFATERQRTILLGTLAVVGAYLGLTAVFEMLGPHSLVFPSYINDQALGIHQGRARGPFLEAAADGLAMFCCAVASVMLLPRLRRSLWKRCTYAVIGLCIAGIVLSLTREVWLGSVIAAVFTALLHPGLRRRVPIGLAGVALVLGVLILALPSLGSELSSRTSSQAPVWDRLNSDAAALRMIESRPALGFGWGTFPIHSPGYYHVAGSYPLTSVAEVHNVPLSNAVEIGIVGLVMWLGALVAASSLPWLRRNRFPELESWRLGMTAVVISWFVQLNFTPLAYAFDNYLPWLFLGIAGGLVQLEPVTAPRPAPVTARAQPVGA